MASDITASRIAAATLIQTEKLAAMGRLAASIAHKLNNPLESVTNLILLARASNQLETVQHYLEMADRELRRAAAITSQTLRFYKQASHAVEPFTPPRASAAQASGLGKQRDRRPAPRVYPPPKLSHRTPSGNCRAGLSPLWCCRGLIGPRAPLSALF